MKAVVMKKQEGYVLIGVLFVVAISMLVSGAMVDSAGVNSKTRALVKTRADYYYKVEETLNKTVAWLQNNSQNLVTAFRSDQFPTHFTLGDPSLGDNEGEHFSTPTMVKLAGTNNSVMLSNNDFFGVSAFPTTTNVVTGAAFDPIDAFKQADLGEANARIVLVWARETDGNFEPVFRVDVVTGNNPDRGVHSFSYIYSTLVASDSMVGFYGQDGLTLQTGNNDCYSYQYAFDTDTSTWNKGAPRANCSIASAASMEISGDVHGNAKTLLDNGISLNPPGGSVTGEQCAGAGCHGYALPTFPVWDTQCPGVATDLNINNNTTISTGQCIRDISIENNKTLTLSDYNNPYYIKSLNFQANFAKFDIGNVPPGEKVTIFVEQLSNNHINGDQFYNPSNAPHQMVINYTGNNEITLNGTAQINMVLTAPNVNVIVNGNFIMNGGIFAKRAD